jgi:hypothetical protein
MFYAYQLPLVPVFGCAGLLLYWAVIKYLLVRRFARPMTIGKHLSEAMTDFFTELQILIFSIGCLVFEKINYSSISAYVVI